MPTFSIQEEVFLDNCCNCGIRFGVLKYFNDERRKDKQTFYCPNGHGQSYKETETDRIRRDRDRLAQQIAQRDDEIAAQRRRAEAAEVEAASVRKKLHASVKRSAAGVCPCCSRSFQALRSHMRTKHPNFKAEVVPLKATA